MEEIQKGKVKLVLVAEDASERTKKLLKEAKKIPLQYIRNP